MLLLLGKGQKIRREDITRRLVEILYERNDSDFRRGTFRVRGDVIEVTPPTMRWLIASSCLATRSRPCHRSIRCSAPCGRNMPGCPSIQTHYVVQPERKKTAVASILDELAVWEKQLESEGRLVGVAAYSSAHRFDLEMIKSMGYCHGIENYSRHFFRPAPGRAPATLLDYFPATTWFLLTSRM